MGTGASAGVAAAVQNATVEEITQALRVAPPDACKKLSLALAAFEKAPAAGLTMLVCGGGNGAHAFAGAVSHRGGKVHVYTPFQEEVDKWHAGGLSMTCQYSETNTATTGTPALVTTDPKEAASGVDIAVVVLPTSVHENVLRAVGPHLAQGTAIGTIEGAWWGAPPLGDGVLDNVTFFGIDTLPWVARIQEYGKSVCIQGTKKEVWVASSPMNKASEIALMMERLVGVNFTTGANLLSLFALDLSLIIHPGLMYGKIRDWDGEPFEEAPLFYAGMDASTAQIMENMDAEAMSIKDALIAKCPDLDLSDSIPTLEWLHDAYNDKISDKSTFQSSFNTNSAYEGLRFPVVDAPGAAGKKVYQFDHRYLTADVPYGLLVVKGIAELLDVATPTIDAAIEWAQGRLGKEWLVDGKVAGKDLNESRAPQKFGLKTLEEFMVGAGA